MTAFCTGFSRLEMPEQALDGIPLGLGLVIEERRLEFSCNDLFCFITVE